MSSNTNYVVFKGYLKEVKLVHLCTDLNANGYESCGTSFIWKRTEDTLDDSNITMVLSCMVETLTRRMYALAKKR